MTTKQILAPVLWPLSLALAAVALIGQLAFMGGLVSFLALPVEQALTMTTMGGSVAILAGIARHRLQA